MEKSKLLTEIKTLIQNQTLYSALIISGQNQEQIEAVVDESIRSLVCANQSLTNDQCSFCRRSFNHTLTDVVYLGDGVNEIGKENVKMMMDQLTLSALEAHGKKIYVVKNAENLKTSAANALLKFLEEPPANTYAFFLTKDRTMILPTIKSRCQLLTLTAEINWSEENDFELILKTKNPETYLLATQQFKKQNLTQLIQDLEIAYRRTIVSDFPQFCEATLILINDLKTLPNPKLAVDNYFIQISERI